MLARYAGSLLSALQVARQGHTCRFCPAATHGGGLCPPATVPSAGPAHPGHQSPPTDPASTWPELRQAHFARHICDGGICKETVWPIS